MSSKVRSFLQRCLHYSHFMKIRYFSPNLTKLAYADISWSTLSKNKWINFGTWKFLNLVSVGSSSQNLLVSIVIWRNGEWYKMLQDLCKIPVHWKTMQKEAIITLKKNLSLTMIKMNKRIYISFTMKIIRSFLFSIDQRGARKMNLFFYRGFVNHNIKVPPI